MHALGCPVWWKRQRRRTFSTERGYRYCSAAWCCVGLGWIALIAGLNMLGILAFVGGATLFGCVELEIRKPLS